MAEKKGRQLNYELLRIAAMFMIVCLHYLSKGGFLGEAARASVSVSGYAAWLIEAFCLVAVNVYVLISGYFGAGTETKDVLRRPLNIWKQVIFYSVLIGVIAILSGIQQFDLYQIFTYIFPIVTEHYWFATSYMILCLFMPFLNRGAKALDKKSLEKLLGGFLLLFCIAKTVLPMHLPWDKYGYDAFWFVTIYLTGTYIRYYGIPFLNSRIKALGLYFGCAFLTFASFLVLRQVYFATGSLGEFIAYAYSYNHLLCYLGAIGLFLAFGASFDKKADDKSNGMEHIRKPIELVSGAAFGVYLIHEHINIRYLWVEWFDCKDWIDASLAGFLGHMTVTVLTVYCLCSLIEIIRKKAIIVLKTRFAGNDRMED